jgi:predicted NBD/HSP70 family sugar kinase
LEGDSATNEPIRVSATSAVFETRDPRATAPKRVLVVDIGGTNVKFKAPGYDEVKFPSGRTLTPQQMLKELKARTKDWDYDVVTIGYPGAVREDSIQAEPANLGKGWVGFDFGEALGKEVKVINDAAMQALGSATKPGLTLFLGVGTGLGVALVLVEEKEGVLKKRVIPTELGHARAKKNESYESLVANKTLRGKDGKVSKKELKSWTQSLQSVVEDLQRFLVADYVVLGGGNVKRLKDFRETFPDARISPGDNQYAFAGGEVLWQD